MPCTCTQGPTATLGLYVNAGSSYERTGQTGACVWAGRPGAQQHANKPCCRCRALAGVHGVQSHPEPHALPPGPRSELQNLATLLNTSCRMLSQPHNLQAEAIGANTLASASREQMVYTVDVVKTNVAEALELLADAVFNPKFQPWDVKAQREKLVEDLKAFSSKPQTAILEVGLRASEALPVYAVRPPRSLADSRLGSVQARTCACSHVYAVAAVGGAESPSQR